MPDTLETYRAKRDFSRTKEPRGRATGAKAPKGLSFVIQKHAARRLHYDLRLELDGALKSWAVAKGPSLVPGDKRLAVHVEDHPMDYADFEGTIPKGEYGGGSVIVWDRGTWEPVFDAHKGLAKGHLEFRLDGEKLHGVWHLVRLKPRPGEKRDNWLLIKSDDEFARAPDQPAIIDELPQSVKTGRTVEQVGEDEPEPDPEPEPRKPRTRRRSEPAAAAKERAKPAAKVAKPRRGAERATSPEPARIPGAKKATMPDFVEPCLATLVDVTPSGDPWVHEVKFDGYRLQARLDRGKVILRTRNGLDWTAKFRRAPFLNALEKLPAQQAIIDGELVVEGQGGVADFGALQDAIARGQTDAMTFYAFDLLYRDGADLTRAALIDRKEALRALLPEGSAALRYSEHTSEGGPVLLRHACRMGLEGIVSKKGDAPYRPGRGRDWVKSKCAGREEFVVGGFMPSTAARRAIGSLALGQYEDGRLVYAGKVGSGFTESSALSLFKTLDPERRQTSPFDPPPPADAARGVRYVEPRLVAEVEFRGRTPAGGLIRHAVFKGLREDKLARDVTREETVLPSATPEPPPSAVKLTHPDRLLWPDAGVTKQGLADFYAEIWEWIRPHVTGRPLALVRCPEGIAGECFFQKHQWAGLGPYVERVKDPTDEQPILAIDSLDGLIALVQAGVLEIHPWGSRVTDLERPDRVTIDLDPGEGVSWDDLCDAAREVRDRLAQDKLVSFCKTTGGKGLHVVFPLAPSADWEAVKAYTKSIADRMEKDAPARFVATATKARRGGKIFVDYLRNARGATAVGAYSTRARPGATVSTPVAWEELGPGLVPSRFAVGNLLARLDSLSGDPWAGMEELRQKLPKTNRSR